MYYEIYGTRGCGQVADTAQDKADWLYHATKFMGGVVPF